MGNVANSLCRGLFPNGMAAHTVCHDKDVPLFPPADRVAGAMDAERVLIVRTANADVGPTGMFDRIKPNHNGSQADSPPRTLAIPCEEIMVARPPNRKPPALTNRTEGKQGASYPAEPARGPPRPLIDRPRPSIFS